MAKGAAKTKRVPVRSRGTRRTQRTVLARAEEAADYVIVGAGMAGAAAARYISREEPDARTVVLEQKSVAHPGGSSYGDSRMYRLMNSSKFYSDMQAHAFPFWDELEHSSGQQLRFNYGLLFYGVRAAPSPA
jgi:sarcosine oxidase